MNARLLFILLAISLMLAFTRRYRKLGFSLSAVLFVLLIWFNVHSPQHAIQPVVISSSSVSAPAPVINVQLQEPKLEGDGAPWHLSGSLVNTSNATIKIVELHIERLDCPNTSVAVTECQVLWQGEHTLRLTLLVGGETTLDERFYSHETTGRPRGLLRDQFTITAVR